MRKRIFGRRFKRDKNERTALFKNLSSELILHERIQTTAEKAKAIKGSVEKLITKARNQGEKARPALSGELNAEALKKLLTDVSLRFKGRPGGYTRIIKLGRRVSDNAATVYLELVEKGSAVAVSTEKAVKKEVKKVKEGPKKEPRKSSTTKTSSKVEKKSAKKSPSKK